MHNIVAMLFERIFIELNTKKVRYFVVGGIAVNLHGYPRVTGDLDILISLDSKNIQRFIEVVQSLGLKPRIPVKLEEFADPKKRNQWIKEKGMKVFSVYNPHREFEHIDVLIESPVDFNAARKNGEWIDNGDIKIPVVSIDDLVTMKKAAGRSRDEIDIKALLEIRKLGDEKRKTKRC